MIKKMLFIVGTVFVLTGCGGPKVQTIKMAEIDKSDKSIYVPGSHRFFSKLRQQFQLRGWKVGTQVGALASQEVNPSGNSLTVHSMDYSSRYVIKCSFNTYWDFGTKYVADCTTLDNKKGEELSNISIHRGEFEQYDLVGITNIIADFVSKGTDESKKHGYWY